MMKSISKRSITMKKEFRVSLAVRVPMNYETRIEAGSEEEAFKLALREFEEGDMTGVDEDSAMWDSVELDLSQASTGDEYDEEKHGTDPDEVSGVYIEEIE
jgi:hypothetical protein